MSASRVNCHPEPPRVRVYQAICARCDETFETEGAGICLDCEEHMRPDRRERAE